MRSAADAAEARHGERDEGVVVDQQAFSAAKAAYQQGDWARAVSALNAVKAPGEVSGAVDHLRGNALMKLGMYRDAAQAYGDALRDPSYGKIGALATNRGRALLASGDIDGAVSSLVQATQDSNYQTPYKAYLALGNAQMKKGDMREAGIAFRNAAIDDANPDPSKALVKLGKCFMGLSRPVDAVEAFRTALDFTTPLESQNEIYAELGNAYVAANRMNEAVDAFTHATSDGTYHLAPNAQAAFQAAKRAVASVSGGSPSETDAMLAAAGYGGTGAYDPLDPTGASGEFMPSPEDTGFFSVSEQDLVKQDKMERKHRHRGLKVFLVILIILLILAGAAGFAYYKGYGYPTQQSVTEELFKDMTTGDISPVLASNVSSDTKSEIETILPSGASVKVDGVDQSMSSSTVRATATLAEGGTQTYTIEMTRSGVSWKVTSVSLVYTSQSTSGSMTVTTGTVATTAATSAAAAATSATS